MEARLHDDVAIIKVFEKTMIQSIKEFRTLLPAMELRVISFTSRGENERHHERVLVLQ
jgi:hypothetical protein